MNTYSIFIHLRPYSFGVEAVLHFNAEEVRPNPRGGREGDVSFSDTLFFSHVVTYQSCGMCYVL